jgi:hypothetical protein
MSFDYDAAMSRNLGFVTADEQARLRAGSVFVCGAGGMGGVVIEALARAGIGTLVIADFDTFEPSNLNRQILATLDTIGRGKTDVARERLGRLRPDLKLEVHGRDWGTQLAAILARAPVVVNAMDDPRAGLRLYREAARARATVIDAYTSPLPSVTRVGPDDPRPEERLGYPTVGVPLERVDDAHLAACRLREIEYVLTHSSSMDAVDPTLAAEMVAGTRPRFSFAPMVIATGALMAGEAIDALLARGGGAGCEGYFLNTRRARLERPKPPWLALPRGFLVRRALARMGRAAD